MPFTIDMLLDYFAVYNESIWPMQWIGLALGLLTLVPLFRPGTATDRVVTAILALLWLWVGLIFWRRAAVDMAMLYAPTVLFAVQGALFLYALARGLMAYGPENRLYGGFGLIFIAYALAGYPLIGLLVGHLYPHTALSPLFPCPATILTFSVFLLARRVPWYLLLIPAFWAISGILWFSLGMAEDAGLVFAGVVGLVMLVARDRASRRAVTVPSRQ
ncbi:MAG: DUF6064 family protein [Anaerolineae bacterium]